MKVRALERGFVGRLVERDEVFDIEPEQFSDSWMVKVEADKPARKAKVEPKAEADPEQADDLA